MFIELNNKLEFVQYHNEKENISKEHKESYIEIDEELYSMLKEKSPWYIRNIEENLYTSKDIEKFVEIKVEVELSQEQKDIRFLAEFNKSLIEAMPLPSEGQANPMLQKLQEIIDRYS